MGWFRGRGNQPVPPAPWLESREDLARGFPMPGGPGQGQAYVHEPIVPFGGFLFVQSPTWDRGAMGSVALTGQLFYDMLGGGQVPMFDFSAGGPTLQYGFRGEGIGYSLTQTVNSMPLQGLIDPATLAAALPTLSGGFPPTRL